MPNRSFDTEALGVVLGLYGVAALVWIAERLI